MQFTSIIDILFALVSFSEGLVTLANIWMNPDFVTPFSGTITEGSAFAGVGDIFRSFFGADTNPETGEEVFNSFVGRGWWL